ncbi:T9SS type A sorting domain-containing protein [Aquimarina mycalae]|uniref:T9SS type A sorting domain-containing protein n=1 Tax=Aquimarina mycalae TaxID=3040073 RepID=UPI00403AEC39
MYPNPNTTGFLNITTQSNTAINVDVYNILGKRVISKTVNDQILNISHLNAGIYIIKLDQNNTSITKKLVIK